MNPFSADSVVWPLTFLLVMLFVLRRLDQDVRPILISVVNGVAQDASSNARAYAIAILFGLSASFSAFWDVFHSLDAEKLSAMSWHSYLANWTKVLNPFIVAILAYATKSDFRGGVKQ